MLKPDKLVSIGFVGSVRYQNENIMLINALINSLISSHA